MIPLQIDPPEHKKFRKLLDPIFAPRKMAAMDQEVSDLVNHLIDGFVERRDGLRQGVLTFPSQVFRPEHVTGTHQGSPEAGEYQEKIADSVYEYFEKTLDERETKPRDDLLSHSLSAEVDGERLTREDI